MISKLAGRFGRAAFAMLVPRQDRRGYRLLWEPDGGRLPEAAEVEGLLRANYHYAHAVNLGQLEPVAVEEVKDGLGRWCSAADVPRASAKPPGLGNFG